MRLDATSRIACPPEVLTRVIDGEAVLLHLGSGAYFGMNDVATRAWEILRGEAKGVPFEQLRSTLLAEFDVEPSVLETDLRALVADLARQQLVTIAHE